MLVVLLISGESEVGYWNKSLISAHAEIVAFAAVAVPVMTLIISRTRGIESPPPAPSTQEALSRMATTQHSTSTPPQSQAVQSVPGPKRSQEQKSDADQNSKCGERILLNGPFCLP